MIRVLLIPRPERADRPGALLRDPRIVRLEDRCRTAEPQPREPVPLLRPSIDEEDHVGPTADVADPRQVVRIARALRLLVERRVEVERADAVAALEDGVAA